MGMPPEESVQSRTKVVVFVDSENMEGLRQYFGYSFKLDYAKLMRAIIGERESIGRYFFQYPLGPKSAGFLNFIKNQAGMMVEMVDRKAHSILDAAIIAKLNTEDITKDADVIILCSGDEDYLATLDALVAQGKQVEIVSIPELVSGSYLDRPGYTFIDLSDLKESVQYGQVARLLPNRIVEAVVKLILPTAAANNFRREFFELAEKFAPLAVGEIDYSMTDKTTEMRK